MLLRLSVVATTLLVLFFVLAGPEPPRYRYDFREGLGPWVTWMKSEQTPTGVQFMLPGKLDPNHLGAAGPLWLVAHLPVWAGGGPGSLDMRRAQLTLRVRAKGLKANGARLSWWIVTVIPPVEGDPLHATQWTNWQLFDPDLAEGLDETWRTVSVTLNPSSASWRYGGNNVLQGEWANRYVHYPIAKTLKHVDATIHLAFVGGSLARPPEGMIEIAEVSVAGAQPSAPAAASYDFAFLERLIVAKEWSAVRYYARLLADAGNVPAAYHFARCMKHGLGGPINEELAAIYFRKAIHQVPEANAELAGLYIHGHGVDQDIGAARRLLETTAALKLPETRFLLALLHLRQLDSTLDPGTTEKHLRFAAERGHLHAMISLGLGLIRGTFGTPDAAQAYVWLRLARNRMTKEENGGVVDLLDHNLRNLAAALGDETVKLEERVSGWTPKH